MSALRELNSKPIAYYPIYRQLTGSTTSGVLLSQLMYWLSKKDRIFKTDADIMEETLLTEKELRNAKNTLKELPFLKITREGIPAKTYYSIDWNVYEVEMNKFTKKGRNCDSQKGQTSCDETAEQDSPKGRNCDSQKGGTINDKSFDREYTENTTERKNIKKVFSFSLKNAYSFESLSEEYKANLWAYAVTKDTAHNYKAFEDYHAGKGTKFKDWSRAYNTWLNNAKSYGQDTQAPTMHKVNRKGTIIQAIIVGDTAVIPETLETFKIKPISTEQTEQPRSQFDDEDYSNQTIDPNVLAMMRGQK